MIRELEVQIQYLNMKKTLVCSLLVVMSAPCAANPLADDAFDMISISADEAYEDERPGILHLNGHFTMQSDDWLLTSGRATVHGSPNRPDRIYLEGSPARFRINQTEGKGQGPVEASARIGEYQRVANSLKLSGGATLQMKDELIRSTHIEYDIGSNRFKAGGINRVEIEVQSTD